MRKLHTTRQYYKYDTGQHESPAVIARRDQKIKVLYRAGYTDSLIAEILKITPHTVMAWRQNNGNKKKNEKQPKTKTK